MLLYKRCRSVYGQRDLFWQSSAQTSQFGATPPFNSFLWPQWSTKSQPILRVSVICWCFRELYKLHMKQDDYLSARFNIDSTSASPSCFWWRPNGALALASSRCRSYRRPLRPRPGTAPSGTAPPARSAPRMPRPVASGPLPWCWTSGSSPSRTPTRRGLRENNRRLFDWGWGVILATEKPCWGASLRSANKTSPTQMRRIVGKISKQSLEKVLWWFRWHFIYTTKLTVYPDRKNVVN